MVFDDLSLGISFSKLSTFMSENGMEEYGNFREISPQIILFAQSKLFLKYMLSTFSYASNDSFLCPMI